MVREWRDDMFEGLTGLTGGFGRDRRTGTASEIMPDVGRCVRGLCPSARGNPRQDCPEGTRAGPHRAPGRGARRPWTRLRCWFPRPAGSTRPSPTSAPRGPLCAARGRQGRTRRARLWRVVDRDRTLAEWALADLSVTLECCYRLSPGARARSPRPAPRWSWSAPTVCAMPAAPSRGRPIAGRREGACVLRTSRCWSAATSTAPLAGTAHLPLMASAVPIGDAPKGHEGQHAEGARWPDNSAARPGSSARRRLLRVWGPRELATRTGARRRPERRTQVVGPGGRGVQVASPVSNSWAGRPAGHGPGGRASRIRPPAVVQPSAGESAPPGYTVTTPDRRVSEHDQGTVTSVPRECGGRARATGVAALGRAGSADDRHLVVGGRPR